MLAEGKCGGLSIAARGSKAEGRTMLQSNSSSWAPRNGGKRRPGHPPTPERRDFSFAVKVARTARTATESCPPRGPPKRRRTVSTTTPRSEEHTSELQSHLNLVCRLLLEKKNKEPKSGY